MVSGINAALLHVRGVPGAIDFAKMVEYFVSVLESRRVPQRHGASTIWLYEKLHAFYNGETVGTAFVHNPAVGASRWAGGQSAGESGF